MPQPEPDLPGDYAANLTALTALVQEAQHRAQRVVNTAMIEFYWTSGGSSWTGRPTNSEGVGSSTAWQRA
jgi:hypothetical protein